MKIISEYAPYVYLNRSAEDTYLLCITILHYEGQVVEIVGEAPYFADGTTMLQFNITGQSHQNQDSTLMRFPYHIVLNPYERYGNNFDLQSFLIEVEVKNSINPLNGNGPIDSKKIKILYQDADEASFDLANNFALNSPYLYLNNPLSEIGGSQEDFNPFCLIFVKGYQASTKPSLTNVDGIYEQTIDLTKDPNLNNEAVVMINPQCIHSNGSSYSDYGEISGYFETIVYQNRSLANGRKGKLRNVSADGDSNPFQI